MSAPVANFNFLATGLSVAFEDLSTNTPTAWTWIWGDGEPNGNTQNPVHVYAAAGVYKVKLTAANADGNSSFEYKIVVSEDPIINLTVEDLVKAELPAGVDISAIELSQLIRKWQIYLQPLVEIPAEISEADMFNQAKWPTLINVLIAKLVVYSYLVEQASRSMISSSTTTGGSGSLKRVESGPSVAEWYNSAETVKTIFKEGGFLNSLSFEICLMAGRTGISLPGICNPFKSPRLFIIGKKPPIE